MLRHTSNPGSRLLLTRPTSIHQSLYSPLVDCEVCQDNSQPLSGTDDMASLTDHSREPLQPSPPGYHDEEQDNNYDSDHADTGTGEADGLLQSHDLLGTDDGNAARSWPRRIGQLALTYLPALVVFLTGSFFATCPEPRQWLPYPARQLLVVVCATLIVIPPTLRRSGTSLFFGPTARAKRLLMSYSGMALALYALIFTSDDVHLEYHWNTLIWYSTLGGPQLGYLTRTALAVIGVVVHRAARLHSKTRIAMAYALCVVGVYADVPMTLIDLAKGRPKW